MSQREQIHLLQRLVSAQKKTIRNLERESEQLRTALRAFTYDEKKLNDEDKLSSGSDKDTDREDVDMDGETNDGEEQVDDIAPKWDENDQIYRCALCNWEVVERECQSPECGIGYVNFVCEETPDGDEMDESDDTFHLTNDDHLIPEEDEFSATHIPLINVDPARLHPETVAYGYEDRIEEYTSLLQRGATRLMCETFSLVYTKKYGIALEMTENEELFNSWAKPGFIEGECKWWTIYLGRQIRLAPDDIDGSEYVDEVLGEALLYGKDKPCYREDLYWVTRENGQGFWETYAMRDSDEGNEDSSSVDANEGDSGDHGDEGGKGEEVGDGDDDAASDNEEDTHEATFVKIPFVKDEYESDQSDSDGDDQTIASGSQMEEDPESDEYSNIEDSDEDSFWDDSDEGSGWSDWVDDESDVSQNQTILT